MSAFDEWFHDFYESHTFRPMREILFGILAGACILAGTAVIASAVYSWEESQEEDDCGEEIKVIYGTVTCDTYDGAIES